MGCQTADTGSNALLLAAALRLVLNGSKMGARLADGYYAISSMSNQAVLTQTCFSARLHTRLHVTVVRWIFRHSCGPHVLIVFCCARPCLALVPSH